MSYQGPQALQDAVSALAILPGIGQKTAQRLVFFLSKCSDDEVKDFANAFLQLKENLRYCDRCRGFSEKPLCQICSDTNRDQSLLCVLENPADVFSVERSGQFNGLYHVLHGRLSPLDGIGPDSLSIPLLMRRVHDEPCAEVILATDPDMEGEATALYLHRLLKPKGLKVTRLAMGIPMGGNLAYTDQITLGRAIIERRALQVGQ